MVPTFIYSLHTFMMTKNGGLWENIGHVRKIKDALHNNLNEGRRITSKRNIARHGFEPRLQDPESHMIDHYTTGLQ